MTSQLNLPGIENIRFPPRPYEAGAVYKRPRRQPERIMHAPSFERYAPYVNFASCTPDRIATVLKSTQRSALREFADLCTYMLETDAHIASLFGTRIAAVEQAPSTIEPASSDDPLENRLAEPAAKFIEAVWTNIAGLEQALSRTLSAIGFGHSAQQVLLKRERNYWTIDKFYPIELRRCIFDDDWMLNLYDNGTWGGNGLRLTPGEVDRERMSVTLVHSSPARPGYPDRWALFRVNVWNWCLKVWITKFWASAAERFGNPLLLAKVPANAPEDVRSQAKSALENLSHDHAGVIEDPTTIEMLKGMIEGGSTFKELMQFLDSRDSKAIVGSTLNTELQMHGSYAAAESQAERTIEPRAIADANRLACDLREQVFTPLLKLNTHLFGGVMPPVPHVRFQVVAEAKTDIQPWMMNIAGTVRRNELRKQANLPELSLEEGGEEFVTQSPAPGSAMPFDEPAPGGEPLADPFQKSLSFQLKMLKTQPTTSNSMNPLERVFHE